MNDGVTGQELFVAQGTVIIKVSEPSESLQFSAQASMTWAFSSIAGSQNQYLNLDVKNGVATSTPN